MLISTTQEKPLFLAANYGQVEGFFRAPFPLSIDDNDYVQSFVFYSRRKIKNIQAKSATTAVGIAMWHHPKFICLNKTTMKMSAGLEVKILVMAWRCSPSSTSWTSSGFSTLLYMKNQIKGSSYIGSLIFSVFRRSERIKFNLC